MTGLFIISVPAQPYFQFFIALGVLLASVQMISDSITKNARRADYSFPTSNFYFAQDQMSVFTLIYTS